MTRPAAVGSAPPYRVLFAGIFLAAFATLLFELSVIRILAFTIWHHFAYVVISTALLGFGAAGSFLAVRSSVGAEDLRGTLARCSLLSAASVAATLVFFANVPLHPMRILDDPLQAILLVAYQIVVATPFFFAGLVVTLCLRAGATRVDRLYFWDLVGAGAACAVAITLMNLLSPPGSAFCAAAMFAVASAVFYPRGRRRIAALAAVVPLLVASLFSGGLDFTAARSKAYVVQRQMGYEQYVLEWRGLFRTDVLRVNTATRDRMRRTRTAKPHILGLSTVTESPQLPSYFVFHDGAAPTGIYQLERDRTLNFLDDHVLRFPYLVAKPDPEVLVIGVGGGIDVITAVHFGASRVQGAELDPVLVELIRDEMDDTVDGFFRQEKIHLVASEGRHFIRTTDREFDLIQLTGVDTFTAMNTGAYVLAEGYLYTVEAIHDYLDKLRPDGVLSFAFGDFTSTPAASARIVSVLRQALQERGIARPQDHIAVIDSGNLIVEIITRTSPFTPAQVDALQREAARLKFQPLLLPGRRVNRRVNRIYEGLVSAEGRQLEDLLASLPFDVTATHDQRPFFMSFFRWSDLLNPGLILPTYATALGQMVLLLLLVILTLLGAGLVVGPLLVFRRSRVAASGRSRIGVLCYFLAVGLGFMMFEITLIQRFVLFLGHPTYSLSVTIGSLLISLGCGSYLSQRWVGREATVLPLAVLAITLLALFYASGLAAVQGQLLAAPLPLRVIATIGLLFPLGLVMGIFFPLGIRRAAALHEDLVPWAWAINGCASVTAGVLAVVLAIGMGFTVVWILSVLIYAFGVVALLATTQPVSLASEGVRLHEAPAGR